MQLNTENMMSISKAMSLTLGSLIDDRYQHVSQCLLEVLRKECRLEHYLSLVRVNTRTHILLSTCNNRLLNVQYTTLKTDWFYMFINFYRHG